MAKIPYLSARIKVAAIKGLQGENFTIDGHHVLATAKHFVAYGELWAGRNRARVLGNSLRTSALEAV